MKHTATEQPPCTDPTAGRERSSMLTPQEAQALREAVLARVEADRRVLQEQVQTLAAQIDARASAFASELDAILARMTEKPSGVPLAYAAPKDREPRPKPPAPALGPAGFQFVDPIFGSRMLRVTDGNTRPDALNRSYRTPSSVHTHAWSADGRAFYVTSTDGNLIGFTFDPETMSASRLPGTIKLYMEPDFSPTEPEVLYGVPTAAMHTLARYDLRSGSYTPILDLQTLVDYDLKNPRTYVGGAGISGDAKRMFAFFGGTGQDRHTLLVVFDVADPSRHWLVDTIASTVNGQPASIPLGFHIHAANIDKSGRFLKFSAASVDNVSGPMWDIETGTFTRITKDNSIVGGHDAYGYGCRINQAAGSPWDAAQWQFRTLIDPLPTRPLIHPVLQPRQVNLADHPSWHHAQQDRLVPFISALYRGWGDNPTPWRAWDDEIVAVQTNAPDRGGAIVWRFAHHRSLVARDTDASRIYFWHTPRPQVSNDGRWVLFTSNWERTLGTDPRAETGATSRQDVFLLALEPAST